MIKEVDITNYNGLKFKPGERVKRPQHMMYYYFLNEMSEEDKEKSKDKLKIISGTVIRVFRHESIFMDAPGEPFYEVKFDNQNETQSFLSIGLIYEDDEKEEAWFKEHDPEGYAEYQLAKAKEEEEKAEEEDAS